MISFYFPRDFEKVWNSRTAYLQMVKNHICLGGASKQNAIFWKKSAPKNAPMHPMSRIGPVSQRVFYLFRNLYGWVGCWK